MIEILNGIHETVHYQDNSNTKLYENKEYEEYPKHWHTALEVIMPTRNEYLLSCDAQTYCLREGDILLICPGCLHHLSACEGERYIFQAELASQFPLKDLESFFSRLYPAFLITPDGTPEIYDQIYRLFSDILQEYRNGAPLYVASIYSDLLNMMVTIRRGVNGLQPRLGASHSKQEEYAQKFTNICEYISEHCTENLTLDEVADRTGFSRYHFTRLFKQFTNMSFYRYVNQKRIDRAASLLINPQTSITEAALSSGYSSLSAFIRMFRIVKSCTPSEFRAMYNL